MTIEEKPEPSVMSWCICQSAVTGRVLQRTGMGWSRGGEAEEAGSDGGGGGVEVEVAAASEAVAVGGDSVEGLGEAENGIV